MVCVFIITIPAETGFFNSLTTRACTHLK
jgi:hypothetical protein